MLLNVVVHEANIQDRDGGRLVVTEALLEHLPELELIWADMGYNGSFLDYIKEIEGLDVEIVQHADANRSGTWKKSDEAPEPKKKGFRVLKWRWIVERTFGWLYRHRRLSKDYEATTESSTCWIYVAMSFFMLRRLTT
jgi:putative transposase